MNTTNTKQNTHLKLINFLIAQVKKIKYSTFLGWGGGEGGDDFLSSEF